MKLSLPDSLSSPEDLRAVILEVRDYARWFADTDIKRRVGSKKIADAPAVSPAATELIEGWGAKQSLSRQRFDELIAALERFRDRAPVMTITLAAPATSDVKQTLVGWCRKNISGDTLVVFRFNSALLGGMVVRHGSRIFDWSFRRQILENRGKFPEVLRRV